MLHFALRAAEDLSFEVEVEEDSADELADLVDEEEGGLGEAFVLPHLHSWLGDYGDAVVHNGHGAGAEVLLHCWSPHEVHHGVLVIRGDHDVDDCAHCLLDSCHLVGSLALALLLVEEEELALVIVVLDVVVPHLREVELALVVAVAVPHDGRVSVGDHGAVAH